MRYPSITSEIHTLDIDIEHFVKFLLSDLQRRFIPVACPSIVNKNVYLAELLDGGVHGSLPVGGLGDVHFVESEGGWVGRDGLLAACLVDIAY
jgi:hypothetical protein